MGWSTTGSLEPPVYLLLFRLRQVTTAAAQMEAIPIQTPTSGMPSPPVTGIKICASRAALTELALALAVAVAVGMAVDATGVAVGASGCAGAVCGTSVRRAVG